MKYYKNLFFVVILLVSFTSFAQNNVEDKDDKPRKNELKINGLYFVMGAFELSYERILNEESSVGISVFLPYDGDLKNNINYYITPYYRHFFSRKYAKGFFVEGFGMLNSITSNSEYYQNGTLIKSDYKTRSDFALGVGVGGKWVTKKGFLAEANLGIGRNLFNRDNENNQIVGRLGLTLGYRF